MVAGEREAPTEMRFQLGMDVQHDSNWVHVDIHVVYVVQCTYSSHTTYQP